MYLLAALAAAAALVVGSPGHGYSDVEIQGPPGAQLFVDGKPVTLFDNDGWVRLKLSAVRHTLSVRRGEEVLSSNEFFIGAGGRVKLSLD